MKGDPKVIEYLNKALKLELTTVNQYFLHARMFRNWGFKRLAKKEYDESIDEMKHADELIERILFLEGLPNVQDLDKVYIGESVKECLECDLRAEQRAHPLYVEAIAYFEKIQDYVSRELMARILESEEEHIDFLETQLELIGKLGEQLYMQAQMSDDD
ncbi:bacterioferritin [Amphiplicatus metriothermophilus]|uniref:Bacterioferritin n=1 Tax=Amphiplicatus metriothermophilus TaxID=1519374 RepID=A0A239PTB6_9PROT|nr:bacterioferritin [Amphiplicatus metriothermophilus]MBB5519102.1 bacterioferritin [Amphiplicatus metriothermophilus]SNT73172.1 bacterioferritin [Amphiplicatus metriothermophilus]